jgi:hypothetical protein
VVYEVRALAHWSELADVNGGDGKLAAVWWPTQSKTERGEGIYTLRKLRRSLKGISEVVEQLARQHEMLRQ